jgi:putative inorganic carbon (HCO3(-)) transporter
MKKKGTAPGIILGTVFRISAWLYELLKCSFIAGLIEKIAEESERKVKRDTSSHWQKLIKKCRRYVSRLIENSMFTYMFEKTVSFIKRCRLRVYGMFFLSWGLYTLLVAIIKRFSVSNGTWNISHVILAAVLCGFSIPLFFSDKKLSEVLNENIVPRALLFSAMGLSVRDLKSDEEPAGKMNIAFICGLALGVVGYAVSPILMVLAMLGIAAACFAMISPEFAVTAILFLLPFLVVLPNPSIALAALVLLTTFSLFLKMIRGKRIVRFEKFDLVVLLFMGAELLGGLVTFGDSSSLKSAIIYTVFILGYFLTVALIKTKKWLTRAVGALMLSSSIVAVYGIYQYFTGNVATTWLDTEMFSDIEGRACSTFENPNMLALYLILLLPMTLASLSSAKNSFERTLRIVASFLIFACTVVTWSRGGWLGMILAVVVLLMMVSSKTLSLFIFGACALPFAPMILPSSIWNRIASIGNLADTSTSYRVNIWKGTFSMLGDFWGSGVGVGQSAFSNVYPSYSLAAIERAPHSHNLFLQILTELGVGGLALFAMLLIAFTASTLNYMRNSTDKKMRIYCGASFCGVLAALMQGMTEYVWYNYRVFFVFWVVLGLSVAFRRCGQAGEEHDSYKLLPGYSKL